MSAYRLRGTHFECSLITVAAIAGEGGLVLMRSSVVKQ
jgi:hypothetical protein